METSSRLPRFAIYALFTICLASFGLMYYAAFTDSAITDELAHIPAGYGYVHNLDYRLNPEHPPLVKALAMAPVILLHPNFPDSSPAWTTEVNAQWDMGGQFLYGSGNDADQIIRVARIFPILLTIGLIILIYAWSEEFLGAYWALLPSLLFGLSPITLAHGHYVTTDIGAAFGFVLASYFFITFLGHPSTRNLVFSGLAFGVAEVTKFSTVLLPPYFLMLLVVLFAASVARDWAATGEGNRARRFGIRAWRYIRSAIIIFAIGYMFVVYPVYFLFTMHYPIAKQISDTSYILRSFAGGPTPAGSSCHLMRCVADMNIWMAKHYLTRPLAQYFLGVLMVLQRADGGNTAYFLGQVSNSGSKLYFPIVYGLKETLPTLLVIAIAFMLAVIGIARKCREKAGGWRKNLEDYLALHFTEFSMIVLTAFYWLYSMNSTLNIGIRHIIPTLPFIYMLSASAWKKWFKLPHLSFSLNAIFTWGKSLAGLLPKTSFLLLLILWFLGETALAAPNFLSYFNEIGGGTWGGYHYVTDSNYDWGQDLLRLQTFVEKHPEIDKIAVDYFGGGNPSYYFGDQEINWWSARGNPVDQNIHWLAVSVNTLEGVTQPVARGQSRQPQDEYRWLTQIRPAAPGMGNVPTPDFRAGTSIFVYHLP